MPTYAAPLKALDRWDVGEQDEVIATKVIDASDPYMGGHYPHFSVYPGVFIIETVRQAVREYLGNLTPPVVADVESVDSVRFQAPLLPGDALTARCRIREDDGVYVVKAKCSRSAGDAAASMTVRMRPRTEGAS